MNDGPRIAEDAPRRSLWADLGPRVASGLILVTVTALGLYIGGPVFALMVGAVFAGFYREWDMMISGRRLTRSGIMLAGLVAVFAVGYAMGGLVPALVIGAVACVVALASSAVKRPYRLAGLTFVGLVCAAVLAIRGDNSAGIWAGLFLGTVVWATDTGAFFTGRLLGGAKLSPGISPAKTWSGALGGLATGTIGGLIVWIAFTESPIWLGGLLAALTSVIGQAGDLAESAVKRWFRIKDSGDIIPGHGGLMDRLDSVTFAALFVFCVGALHMVATGGPGIAEGFLYW